MNQSMNTQDAVSANFAECFVTIDGTRYSMLMAKEFEGMPTIVIGSDNYPPFNYSGTDGRPTGIDVELATEAFHRMGYQAEFVTIDWENKKELLQDGSIDCAWGCFSMDGRMDEYK